MTSLDQESRPAAQSLQAAQERRLLEAWATPKGLRYWSAVNNTKVGLWYTVSAFGFFLFGGLLALVMRIQLAFPGNDFVSPKTYDQLFTMHGSVMMFLFAVPIFEGFSIQVLPQMLGARDLPFPRLSAFGFWCFLIGGLFFCASLFLGIAPEGGWFMYPPLTSHYSSGRGVDIWLLGLSFVEISAIAAAVELIVGVLKLRAPGMRINLIPLYSWYILVVGVMIVFAFPPLLAGDILLELERLLDWPFFDPTRGGDPLLWQHLFWLFGHPEVYIVFLPSVALIAMMVPTFSRTRIVGYGWVVLAAIGTGFLSFGLWVHHMFTTGLPGISLTLFSAASEAIAIPTGIQLFCFIATMFVGRVVMSVPMLYILGGFSTFVIGGLTGVMVALLPFDFQAHDSYFVVGHLHSVLIGGALFPIVAAFYYFFPLVGGKHLSERLGRIAFWLMFVGFNVTFLPMHLTGLLGMPRRVYTYDAHSGWAVLNFVSTVGAFVLAAGVAVFLWDVLRPKKRQAFSVRNPWNAGTLEWLARMPNEPWGVRSIPEIEDRYPLWEQENFVKNVDEGRGYLPDAEEGWRETLVTSPVDANPVQCLRVPGPTFLAFWSAVFVAGMFIFATFHLWWLALGSSLAALCAVLTWLWNGSAQIPEKPSKEVGRGKTLPLYVSGPSAVGWWAMLITMLADMVAFVALIFGYFFYWTIHEDFPPALLPTLSGSWPSVGLFCVLIAWLFTQLARRWNRDGRAVAFYGASSIAALAAILGAWSHVWALASSELDPTQHVYPAMVYLLLIWSAIHVALGVIMLGYCVARRFRGRMTAKYDADITNVSLYFHFAALTTFITVLVVIGFPSVA
jgi:cytochrome c oxidase subunit I+III